MSVKRNAVPFSVTLQLTVYSTSISEPLSVEIIGVAILVPVEPLFSLD